MRSHVSARRTRPSRACFSQLATAMNETYAVANVDQRVISMDLNPEYKKRCNSMRLPSLESKRSNDSIQE